MKSTTVLVFLTFALVFSADAKLGVRVEAPKQSGGKVVIKLTLKNGFKERVESTRATLFLLNDEDKVVGQKSEWIIGGSSRTGTDKPALAPDASTAYNFVLPADKPFTKTKLIFNRIVLEGGKSIDPKTSADILN
jgi:hypothetical protein